MEDATMSAVGLMLDMIGVGILFVYGPPQPLLEEGISIGMENATPIGPNGETVADFNKKVRRRRTVFSIMSRVGLGLIFVGFGSQLFAVID